MSNLYDDLFDSAPGARLPTSPHKRGYVDGAGFYVPPNAVRMRLPYTPRAKSGDEPAPGFLDFSHW